MRYLLDANAVIAALNEPAGPLSLRLHGVTPADAGVSAIVMFELYFAAFKSQRRERTLALLASSRVQPVVAVDTIFQDMQCASEFGEYNHAITCPS